MPLSVDQENFTLEISSWEFMISSLWAEVWGLLLVKRLPEYLIELEKKEYLLLYFQRLEEPECKRVF